MYPHTVQIPCELIATGSKVTVAEINIVDDQGKPKTARFWISVSESSQGRPILTVTANLANSESIKSVTGSYLDLEARAKARA